MSTLKYVKRERIILLNHQELNEKWVQERIAEDPEGRANGVYPEDFE